MKKFDFMVDGDATVYESNGFQTMLLVADFSVRYPGLYKGNRYETILMQMLRALEEYVANDPAQPDPLYADDRLHTECDDTDFLACVVAHFVERYPHLQRTEYDAVQATYMMYMLEDYLEADPAQPNPLCVD